MRDYDREEILMHYGVPKQKRPHGLKYKTRKISNSLYQHRQEQMHPNTETSNEDKQSKEWNKEKYVKDTKTKIDPMDQSKSRKNGSVDGKSSFSEYKISKNKRDDFRKAKQSKEMAEADIRKAFERQQRMFDKKEKTEREKELENAKKRNEDARKRVKKNPLTRYGIIVKRKDPNSRYGRTLKYKERLERSKNSRSINDV